jgi:hypothetical protein
VLRACVLLDEALQAAAPAGSGGAAPTVVAQVKTAGALPLLRYACSARVIPVPTSKINARRYVRLLHNPITAVLSRHLLDFYSPAHASIDSCPQAAGLPFAQLHFLFPDALVVGLASGGSYRLNPPPETVVGPGDDVIALRPERWGGPPASSMPSRRMPALLPLHLS